MDDFQVGDIVAINEYGQSEPTLKRTCTGQGRCFELGERAKVTHVQYSCGEIALVYVTLFKDNEEDNVMPDWIDLVHRPINDPGLYERTLL